MVNPESKIMSLDLEAQPQLEVLPFVNVDIRSSLISCGDDREIDYSNPFIHIFGGALYAPYLSMVLTVANNPETTPPNFIETVNSLVPYMVSSLNLKLGVHSDSNNEHNNHTININDPSIESVGCAFAQKRQAISFFISENSNLVLGIAKKLREELFQEEQDIEIAKSIFMAHKLVSGSLASQKVSGRDLVRKALELGVNQSIVLGEHLAQRGIINLKSNTSLDTNQANQNNNPSYEHDSWAVLEIFKALRDIMPFDTKKLEMADLIDVIGIMLALGVKEDRIEIRR